MYKLKARLFKIINYRLLKITFLIQPQAMDKLLTVEVRSQFGDQHAQVLSKIQRA